MSGTYSSLRKAFEFCLSSFTVKYKTWPQSSRRNTKVNKFPYRTPWLPDFLCNHWFTSSLWNFCCWGPDIPPSQMSFRQGAKRDIAFSSFRLKQEGERGSRKILSLQKFSMFERCCEWTEALRELTGKGQCTAKRGAHVHDNHVIIWMEPLWSLVNISC